MYDPFSGGFPLNDQSIEGPRAGLKCRVCVCVCEREPPPRKSLESMGPAGIPQPPTDSVVWQTRLVQGKPWVKSQENMEIGHVRAIFIVK